MQNGSVRGHPFHCFSRLWPLSRYAAISGAIYYETRTNPAKQYFLFQLFHLPSRRLFRVPRMSRFSNFSRTLREIAEESFFCIAGVGSVQRANTLLRVLRLHGETRPRASSCLFLFVVPRFPPEFSIYSRSRARQKHFSFRLSSCVDHLQMFCA